MCAMKYTPEQLSAWHPSNQTPKCEIEIHRANAFVHRKIKTSCINVSLCKRALLSKYLQLKEATMSSYIV